MPAQTQDSGRRKNSKNIRQAKKTQRVLDLILTWVPTAHPEDFIVTIPWGDERKSLLRKVTGIGPGACIKS